MLERAEHETESLCPHEIEEEAKTAKTPDPPLVFAHTIGVHFTVDKNALLLVERLAFHLRVVAVRCRALDRVAAGLAILWRLHGCVVVAIDALVVEQGRSLVRLTLEMGNEGCDEEGDEEADKHVRSTEDAGSFWCD